MFNLDKPKQIVKAALTFLGLDGQLSLEPSANFQTNRTSSGKTVTVDAALQLSTVWACVRFVSETASTLPLKLYEETTDGGRVIAKNHPLYNVLCKTPNYEMTQSRFLQFVIASILLWGNAYVEKKWNITGKRIIALDPLLPQHMRVSRNKANGKLEYRYTIDGVTRLIDEKDMMHIRGFGVDGVMGVFTIDKGRETFGTAMAAEQTAGKFFENGLQTSGFLSTDQKIDDLKRKKLEGYLSRFMGSSSSAKAMVLEQGMTYQGITMNPEAAQMLQTRAFEVEEICRWFRVLPIMIGHFDKQSSWASSAEAQDVQILKYTFRPLLVNIEQEISRCLIGAVESDLIYPQFNVEGLLRADSVTRSSYYNSSLNNGWMSRNEVRAKENLPPIEGGDTYTVQSALMPLDRVGTNYSDNGSGNDAQTQPNADSTIPK